MSFAHKVTTATYFVLFIGKIKLLGLLLLSLSGPAAEKIQYFLHLSFNCSFQLINGISCDLQKLLKYFNGTAIVAFLKFHLLHQLKDLKLFMVLFN